MSATKSPPVLWFPTTSQECADVMETLEQVVASPHFCNSKRYPALLRFVVEMTLAGKADQLKERTLGIEVFHRPPDYDTNTDTVVRYTAGEVRKRLAVYYHEHGDSDLQITLPAGSYVPEFWRFSGENELSTVETAHGPSLPGSEFAAGRKLPGRGAGHVAPFAFAPEVPPFASTSHSRSRVSRWAFSALAFVLLAAGVLAFGAWRGGFHRASALKVFWAPVLQEQGQAVLCTGGITFAQNNFSGTQTADKDTTYPFASMQIVSSVSQISGLLERNGATYGVQASASTPLSELRDRPVVLFGGYNNEWTVRLLSPLRFHFLPEPDERIVDSEHPGTSWSRDRSQPYSSADDYALVARFRDSTTGSMVVVVAGLGRNGTELASQFVTSERYMELLRQQLGSRLGSANIEVVLKGHVIYGKTGAPEIEAVHVW